MKYFCVLYAISTFAGGMNPAHGDEEPNAQRFSCGNRWSRIARIDFDRKLAAIGDYVVPLVGRSIGKNGVGTYSFQGTNVLIEVTTKMKPNGRIASIQSGSARYFRTVNSANGMAFYHPTVNHEEEEGFNECESDQDLDLRLPFGESYVKKKFYCSWGDGRGLSDRPINRFEGVTIDLEKGIAWFDRWPDATPLPLEKVKTVVTPTFPPNYVSYTFYVFKRGNIYISFRKTDEIGWRLTRFDGNVESWTNNLLTYEIRGFECSPLD